jgi:hypothetical protein
VLLLASINIAASAAAVAVTTTCHIRLHRDICNALCKQTRRFQVEDWVVPSVLA